MPKAPPAARDPLALLPLTPATFQILLALVDGERHGYAIMRSVAENSDGGVTLGPGTLYGSLKRLLDTGVVIESAERVDPESGDERRRYYQLSPFGIAVLRAEVARLDALVRMARKKRVLALRVT